MGNDGGSFNRVQKLKLSPTEGENIAKDDDIANFTSVSKWQFCKLSNKRLQLPIVSDYKGSLFNKEAILEWLLTPGKEDYNKDQIRNFGHIKRLNDVVELRNLKEITAPDEEKCSKATCAIMCEYGENIFGKSAVQLVYLTTCGDVIPMKALEMVMERLCPKCAAPYEDLDVIMIYPSTSKDISHLERRNQLLLKANKHHNGRERKLKKQKRTKDAASSQPCKRRKETSDPSELI